MTDEYICREDVTKMCGEWYVEEGTEEGFIGTVSQMLDMFSPVDVVQVVHAHWIQTSAEDENGNAYYYCSNCGCGESHNPIVEVPYCWKCGAKMDAQGEE